MKLKEATPTLCVVFGFLALLSYAVMFILAWSFYDQHYPNGGEVKDAAFVSTIPLAFIVAICLTCTLSICCKDCLTDCCPAVDQRTESNRNTFLLAILSPVFMAFAGIFAVVGAIMFAVLATKFVPKEDITNLFEVHAFGAAASVFGIFTGLCCCCAGMFCCCAVRGEHVQGELAHLKDHKVKLKLQHAETTI